MEQKELILKAVQYVNDFPARVEEFLKQEDIFLRAKEKEMKDNKSVLMRIAKERGLVGLGLRLKDACDGLIGISEDCGYEYRDILDSLVVNSHGTHQFSVTNLYYQGKWAEIVPYKKKLPTTKDELTEVITSYYNSHKGLHDFINDYED